MEAGSDKVRLLVVGDESRGIGSRDLHVEAPSLDGQ